LEFPENFKTIFAFDDDETTDSLQKYIKLLEYAVDLPEKQTRTFYSCFSDYVNPALSNISWLSGALGVPTSISGFIMSNYNEGLALTASVGAAYALSIPPAVVTAILVGYFGGKTIQGVYDSFIGFLKKDLELPIAIRLYPKTMALLTGLCGFVAYYSSGPAEELVYTNFTDPKWDGIREILIGFARYGIQLYSFINMFEVTQAGICKFAKSVGGDDSMVVELLSERISAMQGSIMQLDGQQFENSLATLGSHNRELLLGMDDVKYEGLIDHLNNVSVSQHKSTFFQHCWPCATEETKPLLTARRLFGRGSEHS
jgi:hypothetical protein